MSAVFRSPSATANRLPSDLIRQNIERTDLPVTVTGRDVNALLSEQSFDAVDLDPFGTPAMVIDAAIRGCRRFLFVTATDTAPLCGAHLKAGIRRYDALPDEHGIPQRGRPPDPSRVCCPADRARYDRGIEPLFCYAREHFVRLHLRILRGANAADDSLKQLGFILQCPSCPYREEQQGRFPETRTCPRCGKQLQPTGPLWMGSIRREGITESLRQSAETRELGSKRIS